MKKVLLLLLWIMLLFHLASAEENLYRYESLVIGLDVGAGFTLNPSGSQARVEEVTSELYLIPAESYRQEVLDFEHRGEQQDGQLAFVWENPAIGQHDFGYSARLLTNNQRQEVRRKIAFPLAPEEVEGLEGYLQPTLTIDSTDPDIIAKATELVEGEEDLFKAVFKLANWVDENVAYDLSTLTAETSQKASWVLEHRAGVCDEMTSLFVAMARSVGIPARFVSGVSYTTSALFAEPWQPHGWAEVYFPGAGWVDFDITFGEYGYIDVTHVKLRDGFDPQEPATRYEWLAHNVNLQAKEILVEAEIIELGRIPAEELELEQEILAPEVGLGSYNLLKGVVKNKADYYAATTLQLAVPPEVEMVGRNRRTLLLAPKEVQETVWIVKVRENLGDNYIYTFPTLIWSEKNISVADSFRAQAGNPSYRLEELSSHQADVEERTYSRKVALDCEIPARFRRGETAEVACTIKNIGNTNLQGLNFCLEQDCERIDLPINQQHTRPFTVEGRQAGWSKIVVTAENDLVQKTASWPYLVADPPEVSLEIDAPETVAYGDDFTLVMELRKGSFTYPQKVEVIIRSFSGENSWNIEELRQDQTVELQLSSRGTKKKNVLEVELTWEDADQEKYSRIQEVIIEVIPASFSDRIRLWANTVMLWFS